MNKPDSLKAHLLAAVPELRNNGDRLVIFIDNGRVRSTSAESLSLSLIHIYSFSKALCRAQNHSGTP